VKKLWLGFGICALFMMVAGGGGTQTPPPPQLPLKITSAAPTSGTVGINYRGFTPTASGGSPPHNWRTAGRQPPMSRSMGTESLGQAPFRTVWRLTSQELVSNTGF
jgi:hypothetical protein